MLSLLLFLSRKHVVVLISSGKTLLITKTRLFKYTENQPHVYWAGLVL